MSDALRLLYARLSRGENAPTVNAGQARAIAELLETGKQAGDPDAIEPVRGRADPLPRGLLLIGQGERVTDPLEGDVATELYAVAEDGRAWSVARAGIAWPYPIDGPAE